jgi:hypothetical protein
MVVAECRPLREGNRRLWNRGGILQRWPCEPLWLPFPLLHAALREYFRPSESYGLFCKPGTPSHETRRHQYIVIVQQSKLELADLIVCVMPKSIRSHLPDGCIVSPRPIAKELSYNVLQLYQRVPGTTVLKLHLHHFCGQNARACVTMVSFGTHECHHLELVSLVQIHGNSLHHTHVFWEWYQ